jgi:hypothetical protein
MDINKEVADVIPAMDDKEEKVIEEKVGERLARKQEQVKQMFIQHYKVPEDAEYLDTLVEREMASAKTFDKLLKQKKKYRELATTTTKTDAPPKGDPADQTEVKNSFEKLRTVEKQKATTEFLQGLVKDYPDRFKDKESVTEAYKKIMAEYKESGDETRREDFIANFKKAFKVSHSDIYEEEIKKEERKRLLEEDVDLHNIVGDKPQSGKGERKFLKNTKINPAKDWFQKKS